MRTQGFTFRYPNGKLDHRVVDTVEAAQSNAAFALNIHSTGRTFPKDWDTAYAKGFRVVPAKIVSTGKTKIAWKAWVRP